MYKVYWTETVTSEKTFSKNLDQLTEMLSFCESLRKRKRNGDPITFITSVSENPNVVGQAGAANVDPEYNWTKRRDGRHPRIASDTSINPALVHKK